MKRRTYRSYKENSNYFRRYDSSLRPLTYIESRYSVDLKNGIVFSRLMPFSSLSSWQFDGLLHEKWRIKSSKRIVECNDEGMNGIRKEKKNNK